MANVNVNIKDSLTDLLMAEKDLLRVYASFLPEAVCPKLRGIIQKNMDCVATKQLEIFKALQANGFYPTKEAEAQAINMAKQTYAPMSNQ